MPDNDGDLLDGCGILLDGESRRNPTDDREVPWIVLFASVLRDGDEAIERKAIEWRELFS